MRGPRPVAGAVLVRDSVVCWRRRRREGVGEGATLARFFAASARGPAHSARSPHAVVKCFKTRSCLQAKKRHRGPGQEGRKQLAGLVHAGATGPRRVARSAQLTPAPPSCWPDGCLTRPSAGPVCLLRGASVVMTVLLT